MKNSSGMATASLILGIMSFLLFPLIMGPLGIVFGACSWNSGGKTGVIVSLVGTVVGTILSLLMVALLASGTAY